MAIADVTRVPTVKPVFSERLPPDVKEAGGTGGKTG